MGASLRCGCLALTFGLGLGVGPAWAQVVERERSRTVTGPRGNSVTRSIQTERGPGFADRQVTITRPNATFQSNTSIQRSPGGFRPGPVPRGFGPGGRPIFVEKNVIVNEGVPLGPALVGGAGLFGLGVLAGSAASAPPPPPPVVVYSPPPVYVQGVAPAPAPVVVATPAPQPPVVMVDEVALAAQRLKSWHESTRRDAAGVLGRLRDPRAIPPLLDRLRNDHATSVRVAAAEALGEIGDARAIQPLQKITIYDNKQEVRDTATMAIGRIQQIQAAMQAQENAQAQNSAPPATANPRTWRPATPAQRPSPGDAPTEATPERVPPPPTPVEPGGSGIR